MSSLTLAEAEQIIAGSKKKLEEIGVKMCVAVVDPRGDLITMIRQDGAPWRSVFICQGKAVASVAWLRPSGELTDNAQSPVSRGLMAMLDGRMIPGQGALPVYRNGEIVGAVGASGGASQQDEDVAKAGIDAIGLSSKP
jgi:glc operon protein GlcG